VEGVLVLKFGGEVQVGWERLKSARGGGAKCIKAREIFTEYTYYCIITSILKK